MYNGLPEKRQIEFLRFQTSRTQLSEKKAYVLKSLLKTQEKTIKLDYRFCHKL